jgi:hypothetical protein
MYTVLVGTPEGRPIGIHMRKWEDNIKTDLKIMGDDVSLIHLAQDRETIGWLLYTQ